MTKKLLLIPGVAILALLALFPPLRWASNWEPGGPNFRLDRVIFGYGASHEWVGSMGHEYRVTTTKVTLPGDSPRTCSTARRAIDWLWLVPEAAAGIGLIAIALMPRRRLLPAPNVPQK